MSSLSYCAHLVYERDRDHFLQCLFVPQAQREGILGLCALAAELEQIKHLVSEEMLGHIRFAWWEENIAGLYENKPRAQPVLEELYKLTSTGKLPGEVVLPLVQSYREHYPAAPPEQKTLLDTLLLAAIRACCPQAEPGWKRAGDLIARHRARFGQRGRAWLTIKLLLAGR